MMPVATRRAGAAGPRTFAPQERACLHDSHAAPGGLELVPLTIGKHGEGDEEPFPVPEVQVGPPCGAAACAGREHRASSAAQGQRPTSSNAGAGGRWRGLDDGGGAALLPRWVAERAEGETLHCTGCCRWVAERELRQEESCCAAPVVAESASTPSTAANMKTKATEAVESAEMVCGSRTSMAMGSAPRMVTPAGRRGSTRPRLLGCGGVRGDRKRPPWGGKAGPGVTGGAREQQQHALETAQADRGQTVEGVSRAGACGQAQGGCSPVT